MQINPIESKIYQAAAKKIGMTFTSGADPITPDEAFSHELGFPLFCLKSKVICLESNVDKINTGISFVKEESHPYGFNVSVDQDTGFSRTIKRVMFIVDSIIELGIECDNKNQPRVIDLNKLHLDMVEHIENIAASSLKSTPAR